jgi:hypothetical protein
MNNHFRGRTTPRWAASSPPGTDTPGVADKITLIEGPAASTPLACRLVCC